MDDGGRSGNGTRFEDARPKPPYGPQLGDRHELVLIDCEGEADMRCGIDEGLARFRKKPEMGDRRSHHKAEFLRFRGPGIVKHPPIRFQQDAGHVEREEMRQGLRR